MAGRQGTDGASHEAQGRGGGRGRGKRRNPANGRPRSAVQGFVQGPSLSDWMPSSQGRRGDWGSKPLSSVQKKVWIRRDSGSERLGGGGSNNALGYVYPEVHSLDGVLEVPNEIMLDKSCSVDLNSGVQQGLLWAKGEILEDLNQQVPIHFEDNEVCRSIDLLSGDFETWGLGYGNKEIVNYTTEINVDREPGRELITVQETKSSSIKGSKTKFERLRVSSSDEVCKVGDNTVGNSQQLLPNHIDRVDASEYPCTSRPSRKQRIYDGHDTGGKQKQQMKSHYRKQKGLMKSSYKSDEAYLSIGGIRIYTYGNLELSDGADLDFSDEALPLSSRRSGAKKRLPLLRQTVASYDNISEQSEEDGIFSTSDIDKELANDYLANGGGDLLETDRLLRVVDHEQLFIEDMGIHDNPRNEMGACLCRTDNNDSEGDFESLEGENEKDNRRWFNILNPQDSSEDNGSDEAVIDVRFSENTPNSHNRVLNEHTKLLNVSNLLRHGTINAKKKKGIKKLKRKEMIAMKRKQRSLLRGFNLAAVNSRLEEIVLNEEDLFAFEPMANKDCVQVQKLASVYHLKSGRQRCGKKSFIIVARTPQTRLPSGLENTRLIDMLQQDEDLDIIDISSESMDLGERRRMASKQKRVAQQALQSVKTTKSDHKICNSWCSKKRSPISISKRSARYAGQPVSFVSHGTMLSDCSSCIIASEDAVMGNGESSGNAKAIAEISSEIKVIGTPQLGKFEAYTKGFGSRMMAKMGFVEGSGLGKDGQGMIQPLEAIKRPKSLGLGALKF